MNPTKQVILTQDIEQRFKNFIVFDDTWLRIGEHEIIVRGKEVYDMFFHAYDQLLGDDSMKTQITLNRLSKTANMLRLVKNFDTVILTKFFDRVWKRYYTISENGEHFLDIPQFKTFFPDLDHSQEAILADRLVKRGGGSNKDSLNDDDQSDNDENSENNDVTSIKTESLNDQIEVALEEVH